MFFLLFNFRGEQSVGCVTAKKFQLKSWQSERWTISLVSHKSSTGDAPNTKAPITKFHLHTYRESLIPGSKKFGTWREIDFPPNSAFNYTLLHKEVGRMEPQCLPQVACQIASIWCKCLAHLIGSSLHRFFQEKKLSRAFKNCQCCHVLNYSSRFAYVHAAAATIFDLIAEPPKNKLSS